MTSINELQKNYDELFDAYLKREYLFKKVMECWEENIQERGGLNPEHEKIYIQAKEALM